MKSILLSIGVREGSATWGAITYMLEREVPMAIAARAFQLPVHRLDHSWKKFCKARDNKAQEARDVWHLAQTMTIEEFQKLMSEK